jgi:two-component system sensor histidine kinase HydH
MSAVRGKLRVPLGVQVGMVAALFLAALVVLWATGASVVAREQRRASVKGLLDRAGKDLEARGRDRIAEAPGFPFFPEERDRAALDSALSDASAAALGGYEGVEGGYFARGFRDFLGSSVRHPGTGLPPREADLIEIQVDAAIRKNQLLFAVEEVEGPRPTPVAIRTEPIAVGGSVVGATWVMARLDDPLFLDRSLRGYQLAAGLALGAGALAFVLTVNLAGTVRRQAADRQRLQAELRRSERLAALGKLLAGVAHEVRNPLAGIRSTVQLWQRGIGPDAESFDDLLAEVDRLDGIVARLLQFSRANAQELAPGDLNTVVAEVARLARGAAEAQGVRVELDLDPALPPVAMSPPALVQVFRNLTTNALQVMPGGGTLRLSTRSGASAGAATARATVSDTGPGLGAEQLAHLFEPFFTTKAGGTGLGLAIAREIALAHRGDLTAGPGPDGPGAAFTLTLPAARHAPAPGPGATADARA